MFAAQAAPPLKTADRFERYKRPGAFTTSQPIPSKRLLSSDTHVFGDMPVRQGMRVMPRNVPGVDQTLNICGSLLDQTNPGMYTYNLKSNSFSPMAVSDELFANGNGFLMGDTYYCFNVEKFYSSYFIYVYKYDINTWTRLGSGYAWYENTPTDLDYDPVSKNVYGCFHANEDENDPKYVWAQYNASTYVKMSILELDQMLVAVACDNNGQYYAIGADSNFYKVEKNTGEMTLVGSTGLSLTAEAQSMTFDSTYGDLYLSAETSDYETGLYTVDPATGRATLVNSYPDGELFLGLYIPKPAADYGAPDAPTDLALNFATAATTGKLTFTMPVRTYGQSDLSGSLDYVVCVDDNEVKTGKANAGAAVSVDLTVEPGVRKFSVYAKNSVGNGVSSELTQYIGPDAPLAVGDLTAEGIEGGIKLTWTAPAEGQNGGILDTADLTYTVVRNNDNTTVATGLTETTYTDLFTVDDLQAITYTVTAYNRGAKGADNISNSVVMGDACSIPWSDDFTSSATWAMYTVYNVANDNYTWVYDASREAAMVDYDFNNPKDDWLITPALALKSDRSYKLEFMTRTKRALPETLEVKMGSGNTIDDMTTVIMEPTTITSEDYSIYDIDRVHEFYITVPEDGKYYIGFHGMSEPQKNRIEIHYIKVVFGGLATAPAAPTELTATPAGLGGLTAEVSFKTPATDLNTNELTSLEKAEIWVNDELAKTIDNPAPGSTITETVSTVQGNNTIMVKAYNEHGMGLESKTTVYTGVVIPGVATNVVAGMTDDSSVKLTWDAPQKGEDGGYIDPGKLTYMIVRNDRAVVAYAYEGTEFIDDLKDFKMPTGQAIVSYQVFARNEAGTGYGVGSNGIVLGDGTYTLPYKESFPDGFTSNTPWGISSTTETSWYTSTGNSEIRPVDGDNGLMMFVSRGPEESSMIYTGRFNLNKTVNPVLSIWYYNNPDDSNRIEVCVTENYRDYTTLGVIKLNEPGTEKGWKQFSVSLKDYIDKPMVAFAFIGYSATENYVHNSYFDLIEVSDQLDYNLEMIQFNAPGAISLGQEGFFAGYVTNKGIQKASGYAVNLLCNGEPVASYKGSAIEPGESATYTLNYTPVPELAPSAVFQAVIDWDKDQNSLNNASEERKVLITSNEFPAVTDLTGERDNEDNVNLSWSAPAAGTVMHHTVESFEDYIPFIINDIGDWTLVDVDGEEGTLGISYGGKKIEFMNATYPHAWQIWNPAKCGMSSDDIGIDVLMPHTGDQCLVSFQDADGVNDDWLISPELNGEAQTLKFWVRTPIPNSGMETFEVYYSTTDKELSSFVKIEGIKEEAFINWEEVAAYLPEGTRYFAIRHTSVEKWLLAVDDISFIAKGATEEPLKVNGYNIYRDGVKIATVDAGQTTYADKKAAGADHDYVVTVVYEQGESLNSNVFSSKANGLDNLTTSEPSAIGLVQAIAVRNAAGQAVSIYAADGRLIKSTLAVSGNEVISMPTGVYVVNVAGHNFKVIVR